MKQKLIAVAKDEWKFLTCCTVSGTAYCIAGWQGVGVTGIILLLTGMMDK